ncbi:hypothetical protein FGG08_004040 [Glutinoglossum americanum]|uniref:RBR-type E3 ubiquitin transferase n=1 Tax=Glutinoglossum americanum TaxID=1670608 RepID=A0A9P8I5X7_9PEZI|nr:hypothetical protein FGG08_004040 [Glutinoglossum americanum]
MAHASEEVFSSADCRRRLGHRGRRLRPRDDFSLTPPPPPHRPAQEAGSAPKLLDIDYLGRLRAEFYNNSSEWRKRSSSPRMPYVSEGTVRVRAQDIKSAEKKKGKEREHGHRHHSDKHRRRKERADGGSEDERVNIDKTHTGDRDERATAHENGGEGPSPTKREMDEVERSSVRDKRPSRHKDERRKRSRDGTRERTPNVEKARGYDRDHGSSLLRSSSRNVRPRESSIRPKDSSMAAGEASRLTRSASVREPTSSTSQLPLKRSNTTTNRTRSSSTRPPPHTGSSMPSTATEDGKARDKHVPKDGREHKNGRLLAAMFGFQPPRPPRGPEKMLECLACLSDSPASKAAKLPCGHIMCHDCLTRIFTLSVTDPQHMPPKCCTQDHIPLRHVDRLFDIKFKKLWNQKYQEYTTKNRIYCPSKGCGEWIKPANIHTDNSGSFGGGRKYGKCGRCKTKVCCLCNGRWHVGKDCPKDEETNRFVEVAKKEGWQRCYNCSAMVELKEGCNHMTCRCKAEFCMICAAKWKSCDCPLFSYDQADNGDYLPMPFVIPAFRVAGRNRRPPFGYVDELERRRDQERADEELARRLQTIDLANIDLAGGRFGANDENFARIAADIAAGGEILNQAMRNHVRPFQRQQRYHNIEVNRQRAPPPMSPPPPPPLRRNTAPSPPPFPPIDPQLPPTPPPLEYPIYPRVRPPHPRHRPRSPTDEHHNPSILSPPPSSYHTVYVEPQVQQQQRGRGVRVPPPPRPPLRRRVAGYPRDFAEEFNGRYLGGEEEEEDAGYLTPDEDGMNRRVDRWLDEVPDGDVLVDMRA